MKIIKILFIIVLIFNLTACKKKLDSNSTHQEELIHEEDNQKQDEIIQEDDSKQETSKTGIRPEFKEAMDSYEAFFDEYIAFMKKYSESDDAMSLMSDYLSYMTKFSETMSQLENLDEDEMSDEEVVYYTKVMLRINEKLLDLDD